MRYQCQACGQWVKDKFIFGLLHFCPAQAQEEEAELARQRQEWAMKNQKETFQKERDKMLKYLGLDK